MRDRAICAARSVRWIWNMIPDPSLRRSKPLPAVLLQRENQRFLQWCDRCLPRGRRKAGDHTMRHLHLFFATSVVLAFSMMGCASDVDGDDVDDAEAIDEGTTEEAVGW